MAIAPFKDADFIRKERLRLEDGELDPHHLLRYCESRYTERLVWEGAKLIARGLFMIAEQLARKGDEDADQG